MKDLALLQAEAAAGLYRKPIEEIAKAIHYEPCRARGGWRSLRLGSGVGCCRGLGLSTWCRSYYPLQPVHGNWALGDITMAKAYWVATYRSVSNPEALAAYAKLSGPAVTAAGGRILVRGMPAHLYEAGLQQRTVVIEFDSVEQARAAHDSPAYQEALAALAGGAERDVRIVEGV